MACSYISISNPGVNFYEEIKRTLFCINCIVCSRFSENEIFREYVA